MKIKNLLSAILIATSFTAFAQVGIGTTSPEGVLDVVSTDSGIIPPRVANAAAVTSPVNGMLIYDISIQCVRVYENGTWSVCISDPVPRVVSATGRIWMDRNLGATRVATSSTDADAYGDLYQWGRAADGHQLRTSGTTTTLSATDAPSHGNFILKNSAPYDWRSSQNDNLWQDVNGINNPCPTGYRLPTDAEWTNERSEFLPNNAAGAHASLLKLPVPGVRFTHTGALSFVGSAGYYWSSTVSGTNAGYLNLLSGNVLINSNARANGYSVRCIKD